MFFLPRWGRPVEQGSPIRCWRMTYTTEIMVWKMYLLSNMAILSIYVKIQGVRSQEGEFKAWSSKNSLQKFRSLIFKASSKASLSLKSCSNQQKSKAKLSLLHKKKPQEVVFPSPFFLQNGLSISHHWTFQVTTSRYIKIFKCTVVVHSI